MKLPILGQLAVASFFIPVAAGYLRRKNLAFPSVLFFIYTIIAALEVIVEFGLSLIPINNFALSYFYRVIEVTIVCTCYLEYFKSKRKRPVYFILPIVFLLVVVYDIVAVKNIYEFKPFIAVVERICLIIASLVVIFDLAIKDGEDVFVTSFFWFSAGTVLYCLSTIVIFGFSDNLAKIGVEYFILAWNINWIMAIATNLIYARGFWCK